MQKATPTKYANHSCFFLDSSCSSANYSETSAQVSFHWRGWQQFLLWTKIRFPVQFTWAVFRYIDTDELKKLWPCEAPFCHKAKHPLPPLEQSDTMDGCMEGRMDGLMDNWLCALYSSWYIKNILYRDAAVSWTYLLATVCFLSLFPTTSIFDLSTS